MLANSHLSSDGKTEKTTRQDLQIVLEQLWRYLQKKGDMGEIAIPVISTGHAITDSKYEDVVRQILRSFIASCADNSYCKKLIIVVFPGDIDRYDVDPRNLDEFLECSCKFAHFD